MALLDPVAFRPIPAEVPAVRLAVPFSPPPFMIVGHRGSPVVEVENTLPSFSRAIEEGANALEIDVSITRDRELVLWHDDDPDEYRARFRQWGLEPYVGYRPRAPWSGSYRRATSTLTIEELRRHYGYAEKRFAGARVDRRIPTLPEFFEWAARERRLELVFLDMKLPPRNIRLVGAFVARIAALHRWFQPRFRVVLESAYPDVVVEIARLTDAFEVVLDVEPHPGVVVDFDACSAVRAAIRHGLRHAVAQKPRSITLWPFATHRRIVEKDLALLRAHNRAHPDRALHGLCSFLINEAHEMQSLIDLGVVAIQTDLPARLRAVAEASDRLRGNRAIRPAEAQTFERMASRS